ncbi:RCC1 domain-containing protein [Brevibacillus formosus]|uniref:RCC1 domain-containing protein n=1 Tax=Brevibacillus formosus TaxID=54913 RepID=UPI000B5AA8F0
MWGTWEWHNNFFRKKTVQVENLDSVVDIQAGTFFSLALKSDGTVWSWGDGTDGKLG